MKRYNEKRETFKKMYMEGKTIKGIARELKVTAITVRSWRNLYYPPVKPKYKQRKEKFKRLFLINNKDSEFIAKTLNVCRTTVYIWKEKYFSEIPGKEELFLKIINKKNLSVNEIAYLLGMCRSSVLRLYKKAGLVPDELK
jgi:transposase